MARSKKPTGYFLAFEGGEGSGKSTQARLLHEWLATHGIPSLLTREPGGTDVGNLIRGILLDKKHEPLAERAELLLYVADRAQHMEKLILPEIQRGAIVLCDRHADSSTVYQGICRGLGEAQTTALNRFSTAGIKPDLVVLLDIPAEAGMARVAARASKGATLDRMESEAMAFHKKVRAGFLKLARKAPARYVILDARKLEQELAKKLQQIVVARLKRRGLWTNDNGRH